MKQRLIYLMTSTLNALTSNTSSRLYLYFLSGPVILLRFVFVTLYFTINDDDLANNNIFALLMFDHTLLQKITPAHLNSIVQNGDYAGESALYFLASNPEGRQLLVNDHNLRQMITKEALNSIVQNGQDEGTQHCTFWQQLLKGFNFSLKMKTCVRKSPLKDSTVLLSMDSMKECQHCISSWLMLTADQY